MFNFEFYKNIFNIKFYMNTWLKILLKFVKFEFYEEIKKKNIIKFNTFECN